MLLLQENWNECLAAFPERGSPVELHQCTCGIRSTWSLCVPISEMESKFTWTRVNLQPQVTSIKQHVCLLCVGRHRILLLMPESDISLM